MARQLTPEALFFIQRHHYTLPENEAYASRETIIDVELPNQTPALNERRGSDVASPNSSVSPVEDDIFEVWLRSASPASPASPAPVGGLARVLAVLQRVLWLS